MVSFTFLLPYPWGRANTIYYKGCCVVPIISQDMGVNTEISAVTRNRILILALLTAVDCLLILSKNRLLTAVTTCPFLHWLPSTHQVTSQQQTPRLNGQADLLPTCVSSCSTLQYKHTECVSWHLLALCLRQPADRIQWVINTVNTASQ